MRCMTVGAGGSPRGSGLRNLLKGWDSWIFCEYWEPYPTEWELSGLTVGLG